MTNGSGRLVIRCIIAIPTTAINIGTMDSAVAQSRIGQIGRDGLTNRHEAPIMGARPHASAGDVTDWESSGVTCRQLHWNRFSTFLSTTRISNRSLLWPVRRA